MVRACESGYCFKLWIAKRCSEATGRENSEHLSLIRPV